MTRRLKEIILFWRIVSLTDIATQAMKVDPQTENPDLVQENPSIIRSNEMEPVTRQREDPSSNNAPVVTRSNSTPVVATSSNTIKSSSSEEQECATRHNNIQMNIDETTEAKVSNPFQTEDDEDDGESLDDLGPELAKMGRILNREITKSLSKALMPLQHEINELKASNQNTGNIEQWHQLKDENDKLNTKVHQLEIRNHKLQEKLNRIEDKLIDNNLLFFGISEMEGESEQDRYAVVPEVISSTFIGQTQEATSQECHD